MKKKMERPAPLECEKCGCPIGSLASPVMAAAYPTLEFAELECPEDIELTIGEFLRQRHVLLCTACIMYGHIAAKARQSRREAHGSH